MNKRKTLSKRTLHAVLVAAVLGAGAAHAATPTYSFRVVVPQIRPTPTTAASASTATTAVGVLSPVTTVDFGQVSTGKTSLRSFTFTNTGTANASGVQASVVGTALSLVSNTCGTAQTPGTVSAGGSCTLTIQYAPLTQGALSNATLTVASSAQGSPNTLGLTGSAIQVPSSPISTVGLVAYYPFASSASGATAGSPVLSAVGAPAFSTTDSPFGANVAKGALSLNGASAYRNGGTAVISGSGDYSFGMWVKTTSTSAGSSLVQQRSGFRAGAGDNYGQYYLVLLSGKVCYADGNMYALKPYVCSSAVINDGTWHHVGFVRPAVGGITVYVDGVPTYSSYAVQAFSTGGGLSFGFDQRDNVAYYPGAMRDAWFFNRALSNAEFATLVAARTPLIP